MQDQVAFVAGSSRGIGRAIAAALLAEGARVVITGRASESLEVTRQELEAVSHPDHLLAICGDLADRQMIERAYEKTIERFGRVDHLIANLGTGAGTPGPLPPAEDWTRLFEMNFFASVRLTEALIPRLREQRSGTILYISSIVAREATAAPLPYSAAKAALTNYAKNLSRQIAADGIRVNTICPGNILFPGGSWQRRLNDQPSTVEQMLRTDVPQARFGTPDEIASLAVYLCSSRSSFTTGGTFVVDGGQTRSI